MSAAEGAGGGGVIAERAESKCASIESDAAGAAPPTASSSYNCPHQSSS
ncbi:hypothetical protein [Actinacidiphila paucisporea]|nr:hypothetical protein [Actinacidiphila paucisporea]